MAWKSGLVAAILITCAGPAAPAAAGDRPIFDFKGEMPVPGGTVRLEARCESAGEAVRCRAEGRGPSGRGFQAEGRFLLAPPAPAAPEPTGPQQNSSQWF